MAILGVVGGLLDKSRQKTANLAAIHEQNRLIVEQNRKIERCLALLERRERYSTEVRSKRSRIA